MRQLAIAFGLTLIFAQQSVAAPIRVLFLTGEQQAGSFVDTTGRHVVNTNGTVTQSASTPGGAKYGSTSMNFQGGGLSLPDSPDWTLGSTFTIDWWQRHEWEGVPNDATIYFGNGPATTSGRWGFEWTSPSPSPGDVFLFEKSRPDQAQWIGPGIMIPNANIWTHYAIVRDAGIYDLYIDGTNAVSLGATKNIRGNEADAIPDLNEALLIGNVGIRNFQGQMDNFRITLDGALFTENFNTNDINYGVVPEPSTFALLLTGGVGLLGYGWRRKRGAAANCA
jgi:hypothetical protein